MRHYDLCRTDGTPRVVRHYMLNAMHECGIGDTQVRVYANLDTASEKFREMTDKILDQCNGIYEERSEREAKDSIYRQTSVYRQFSCLMDIRALINRCVDEKAYKALKKAMRLIEDIESEAFAEDRDGNTVKELLPYSKPEWKRD